MIKIKVLGTSYDFCEWNDITLANFLELISIPIPDRLKIKWEAMLKGDDVLYTEVNKEISYSEIVKTFPEYYGKILKLCSTIPQEIIDRIDWTIREQLFTEYFYKFVITGLADLPQDMKNGGLTIYEPQLITSFDFEGETFFMPKSLERGGNYIPLVDETIVTFSEAADVEIALHEWSEKGIEAMAQIIAVYCLKADEKHNDQMVIERTDKFKNLPMDIIWEVFFCIISLGLQSQIAIKIYSEALQATK